MNMRDKIAEALWPDIGTDYTWPEALDRASGKISDDEHSQIHHRQTTEYARRMADLVIEAIPDMIPDLVWVSAACGWTTDGYFIMPVTATPEYRVYGAPGDWDSSEQCPTLDEAKAAANTHHRAEIMKSFGLTTPDDAVEGE